MEFFHRVTSVDFIGRRNFAYLLSAILFIASIASMAVQGLKLGLDFTGGTVIEATWPEAVELDTVRAALHSVGQGGAAVQHFGSTQDLLIRIPPVEGRTGAQLSEEVLGALRATVPGGTTLDVRRVEYVGPQVGKDLVESGVLAILVTFLGIFVYVALRFEWKFSVGALAASLHDPVITLGAFSLLRIDFDLAALAAVLAVLGYSINDTIVVFDRIRENFRKMRKGSPEDVMNGAVNQTLSRTVMTSGVTLITVVVFYLIGGDVLHGFSVALLVGIVIGTYSSIFVAAPIALALGASRADLMQVRKEQADDGMP